jgi:hypothetical protein
MGNEDMEKLRSLLECKNTGAEERKEGGGGGRMALRTWRLNGVVRYKAQVLQDRRDVEDCSEEAKAVVCRQVAPLPRRKAQDRG